MKKANHNHYISEAVPVKVTMEKIKEGFVFDMHWVEPCIDTKISKSAKDDTDSNVIK